MHGLAICVHQVKKSKSKVFLFYKHECTNTTMDMDVLFSGRQFLYSVIAWVNSPAMFFYVKLTCC